MTKSNIEWTEQTWNPIVGCSHVSEGCENCYAERMAYRLASMAVAEHRAWNDNDMTGTSKLDHYCHVVDGNGRWNGQTALADSALLTPHRRKKPTVYFVGSMGDIFHDSVPFAWIDQVFSVMAQCPQHTFMILTKRPENIEHKLYAVNPDVGCTMRALGPNDYLPNVWLGVTAENQKRADERIPQLLAMPAAGRFVSIEPMLGPVDLYRGGFTVLEHTMSPQGQQYGRLDQVIVGGESGPRARPIHPYWVRDIRDQCAEAGVPFLFKQWGEHRPAGNYTADGVLTNFVGMERVGKRVGKKPAGRVLDGTTHDELAWRL